MDRWTVDIVSLDCLPARKSRQKKILAHDGFGFCSFSGFVAMVLALSRSCLGWPCPSLAHQGERVSKWGWVLPKGGLARRLEAQVKVSKSPRFKAQRAVIRCVFLKQGRMHDSISRVRVGRGSNASLNH